MKIPNIITTLRIALIPCLALAFYLPYQWSPLAAAGVFALAAATDWVDGYLARKLDQATAFGAFLDPVADKLTVAIALIMLVESYADIYLTLTAAIIVGRELVISALREWMAEIGQRSSVSVSMLGKVKTGFQMSAIFFLLLAEPHSGLANAAMLVLYIAALLTVWSMWIYLRASWTNLVRDM
ncbi:MAG: CDP-diacylglycerol--glycerol-3-phosphate 3-phosphatidyltransferase [Motiliproteus sp.]|jgi:CDP-diacylglycerol--glycerol-3-phosphate 3-phosphatidyltransferase